jgi:hypothetical protein
MSNLDQDLRKAEAKARSGKFLYLFVLACAVCGIIGGFVYWTLSDLPQVNAIRSCRVFEGVFFRRKNPR